MTKLDKTYERLYRAVDGPTPRAGCTLDWGGVHSCPSFQEAMIDRNKAVRSFLEGGPVPEWVRGPQNR